MQKKGEKTLEQKNIYRIKSRPTQENQSAKQNHERQIFVQNLIVCSVDKFRNKLDRSLQSFSEKPYKYRVTIIRCAG